MVRVWEELLGVPLICISVLIVNTNIQVDCKRGCQYVAPTKIVMSWGACG